MIVRSRTAQRTEVWTTSKSRRLRGASSGHRDLSAHPEAATGHQSIWLQSFKKENFLFVGLDIPPMSNTAAPRVFRCAARNVVGERRWPGKRGASSHYTAFRPDPGCVAQGAGAFDQFSAAREGFSFAICLTLA